MIRSHPGSSLYICCMTFACSVEAASAKGKLKTTQSKDVARKRCPWRNFFATTQILSTNRQKGACYDTSSLGNHLGQKTCNDLGDVLKDHLGIFHRLLPQSWSGALQVRPLNRLDPLSIQLNFKLWNGSHLLWADPFDEVLLPHSWHETQESRGTVSRDLRVMCSLTSPKEFNKSTSGFPRDLI